MQPLFAPRPAPPRAPFGPGFADYRNDQPDWSGPRPAWAPSAWPYGWPARPPMEAWPLSPWPRPSDDWRPTTAWPWSSQGYR